MKYCAKCGTEMLDEAVLCVKCGSWATDPNDILPRKTVRSAPKEPSTTSRVALVFMIIGTILTSIYTFAIGLVWCLPMTISYCRKINNGKPVGAGFKICSLIFISAIAGILMLCDKND